MGITDRNTIKSYFERGDQPTEAQFVDLIDSTVNKTDDTDLITPSISSGDKYKSLIVKQDESGYEISPLISVTPESFGATGDGVADDTAALQDWLNFLSSNNQAIGIASGSYKYVSTLQIKKNTTIKGAGIHDTRFVPTNCEAFLIEAEGGSNTFNILVQDLWFDCDNAGSGTDLCKVEDSFRVTMKNIRITDVDPNNYANGFAVRGDSNNNQFTDIRCVGTDENVDSRGLLVDVNQFCSAIFFNPDFESFNKAYNVEGGSADFHSPYSEGSTFQFYFNTAASERVVNLYGGILRYAGSDYGMYLEGDLSNLTLNVYSPKLWSNGTNPKNGIETQPITAGGNLNVYGVDTQYISDDEGWLQLYGTKQHQELTTQKRMITKSLADNTSTGIARLNFGNVLNGNLQTDPFALISVKAVAGPGGIGLGYTKASFAGSIRSDNGDAVVTSIQEDSTSIRGESAFSVDDISLSVSTVNQFIDIEATLDVSGSSSSPPYDVIFMIEIESNCVIETESNF